MERCFTVEGGSNIKEPILVIGDSAKGSSDKNDTEEVSY